MLTQTIIMRIL